jgi:serine/threonine protein kinase
MSFEGQHPDENTLVEYVRGALSHHGRLAVNVHVDECNDCRQTLAALARHVSVRTAEQSIEAVTQPNATEMLAGTVLDGRFRLLNLLGGGAMGIVFEAEDLQLKERVAVKVLASRALEQKDGLELLRREILLARRVSHPNVCPVYDLGIAGDRHYITMKLVEGRTLDQLLDEGPVSAERAAMILDQLASALATAHEKGVVHRDLKAANVMVSKDDHVWVMDFGLARDLERDPSFSGPVGTPAYWAPEQALGEPATPAADMYSFGVVAYRLFTGKLPRRFTQKTNFDIVPAKWRRLVARCMSERTALRPPNGAALLQEWRAVGSWRRRVPLLVAASIAVAALAVVLILLSREPSTRETSVPTLPVLTSPRIEAPGSEPPLPEPTAPLGTDAPAAVDASIDPPDSESRGKSVPVRPKKKPKPVNDIPLFD